MKVEGYALFPTMNCLPVRSLFFMPRFLGDGTSVLGCDAAFSVDRSAVVLSSPLILNAVVTCNGTHVLTAADVDNLERRSGGAVTAVDEYSTEVSAEAAVVVVFEQVRIKQVRRMGMGVS